ncbi:MAG: YloN [Parcubacteria group bacterium Gr01-1014_18]|nr:MAG: YloN [Parcubacteria group bacterium Greene0416_36]TSC81458.1 MAG: YloN [Parcubacteria group bacterium Gr01-1014_18]TSC99056.1 MAG: YloN [Parcubacteria group bacterium Greene1014_20]TSD07263.1 MAG: YloN [Parcubacteria group bacterium Greene0714_2]
MTPSTRAEQFASLFPTEKPFRAKQLEDAVFNVAYGGWKDVTVLPAPIRAVVADKIPWISLDCKKVMESKKKDTYKAALCTFDGHLIESVLMENARDQWTICVSSQIGCAMKCTFCATGKMGLSRNLSEDEIVDQYRFWVKFLREHPALPQRISNVVFMGMGEPMANYENVKSAIKTWLEYTDLGETKITVSTVGLMAPLEKLLADTTWPHVRLAVSLHSADKDVRGEIVPSGGTEFLNKLQDWGRRYLEILGNRSHHLTFEYVLLSGHNDRDADIEKLLRFVQSVGRVRVNLIPYNFTDSPFRRSEPVRIQKMVDRLESADIPVTVRKTMGDDIAGACGQLITEIGRK